MEAWDVHTRGTRSRASIEAADAQRAVPESILVGRDN